DWDLSLSARYCEGFGLRARQHFIFLRAFCQITCVLSGTKTCHVGLQPATWSCNPLYHMNLMIYGNILGKKIVPATLLFWFPSYLRPVFRFSHGLQQRVCTRVPNRSLIRKLVRQSGNVTNQFTPLRGPELIPEYCGFPAIFARIYAAGLECSRE